MTKDKVDKILEEYLKVAARSSLVTRWTMYFALILVAVFTALSAMTVLGLIYRLIIQ